MNTATMTLGYMAQNLVTGEYFHIGHNSPKKWLCDYFDRPTASKMFVDTDNGPKHVGYIIGGRWLEIFKVCPWDGETCEK